MKSFDPKTMTDAERRDIIVAVAEACGYERLRGDPWKRHKTDPAFMPLGWTIERFMNNGEPALYWRSLPDYLIDSNAALTMERKIISQEREAYFHALQLAIWPHRKPKILPADLLIGEIMDMVSATPSKRTEAFCRTYKIGPFTE
jgi:hypothetical protein